MKAIYAFSGDPITKGHIDIIERAAATYEHVTVGIGANPDKLSEYLLTRRELEVLSDLASGRTNKQIARDLGVSLNTVKFHVRNLFQKLGVNSRSQAISMYLRS